MNYTLRQLEVFTQICASKSITKAAEVMHMSQPAASIQLKNFQAQFDIPLTEVIGRQLYVTQFGDEIREACINILEETKKIEASAMSYHGHLTGKIRISIVSTGKYIMPHFLTDFMNTNPSVELVMDVTNKTSVLASLDENQVDFSLVSILPELLSIDKIELMKNSLYLVGGRASESVKSAWSPSKLSALPMIYREQGSGTRQTMERFLERHGVQPVKRLELTSNEAVKQAVVAGLGYSIMPLIGIRNELERGDLKIIPVKGLPEETSWNLIWLKSKKFLPAAKAFLTYIQAEKERIIQHRFEWYK
ncbi:MAG: LysR family transcriptional regulator [Flavobacteriales bacterium]|nr:LysR family transcriptional regulator [Flavobacteriales bacterium]